MTDDPEHDPRPNGLDRLDLEELGEFVVEFLRECGPASVRELDDAADAAGLTAGCWLLDVLQLRGIAETDTDGCVLDRVWHLDAHTDDEHVFPLPLVRFAAARFAGKHDWLEDERRRNVGDDRDPF